VIIGWCRFRKAVQFGKTAMSERKARCKYMQIPTQPGSQYTNDQRIAVISDYVVLGNQTKVSELHSIPLTTVHEWIKSEWGVELTEEIRSEKGPELDANFTKLIDSAFEQAQDRVENGDYRVTKDGKLIRVPMGGKELVISGATVYDKQRLHRNQPTAISGKSESMNSLAQEFRKLSQQWEEKQINVVATQEESEELK